ncbi:MAG: succinate dehydrogenase/fumarate reductase iron-sulfur subunit [Deltaproteobacteria bacterium]|nr:succinate dehydrogenase/fumarate reductase iron-sulfur subunit [Deltaproteobacteria bacterium]
MKKVKFRIFRGTPNRFEYKDYNVEVNEGMVVLDAIHQVQAKQDPRLAVRWNCKAGKCGSCSMEINGKPKLACMTRLDTLPQDEPITVAPMKAFPVIKDLVCDVSWNYEMYKKIPEFKPNKPEADGTWRMRQEDVERGQEFRKCIQCFLCQDVCHVIRNHKKDNFIGPALFAKIASLEMHPHDTVDRIPLLKESFMLGYCNITKCCTEVCPEHIKITDNAIIPLKERVVTRYYDPIAQLFRKLFG